MSLRLRLVAGLVLITAVGLALAGTATFVLLRSYLLDRVDSQLEVVRTPLRVALAQANADGLQTGPLVEAAGSRIALPPGTYGEIRRPDGSRRIAAVRATVEGETDVPRLPDALPGTGGSGTAVVFSADGIDADVGADRYRVLAEPMPAGGTLIVAVPLDDVEATLDRLVVVEAAVSAVVLTVVAVAGWLLVARNLRPLARVATTAEGITAGALDRRIPVDGAPTEVRQVGTAMNTMLERLEGAFADQYASEDRLRRFLADASHELRTPLTSIRGYAELFRRGADRRPEDLATAMRRIEDEADRMGRLVEDLLLLARLDERPEMAAAPVALDVVADDAVADGRAAQPDRALDADLEAGVVVMGDEAQLRQVAANLVTNALVHTPTEAPVVVRVRRRADEAVLEVADGGPGLAAEQAARVWDRFERADPGRSRHTGGTGLGLAIVAALVQAHGGRVELDTTPDEGATFRVVLPAAGPDVGGTDTGARQDTTAPPSQVITSPTV